MISRQTQIYRNIRFKTNHFYSASLFGHTHTTILNFIQEYCVVNYTYLTKDNISIYVYVQIGGQLYIFTRRHHEWIDVELLEHKYNISQDHIEIFGYVLHLQIL